MISPIESLVVDSSQKSILSSMLAAVSTESDAELTLSLSCDEGDGPGGAAAAGLERAVRAERVAVLDAAARGAAAGRRRPARQSHGGRPRRRLHGPHSHIPGTGRETQGAPRRLGRVLVSQSHRPLHHR